MYEFLSYEVRDVMAPQPRTLTPMSTIGDAQNLIETYGFNALPIVDGFGRLAGLISQFDVLRAFTFSEAPVVPDYEQIMKLRVDEFMTKKPKTVTPGTSLVETLELMVSEERKSLPVVDGDILVGMITRQDLAYALRLAARGEEARWEQ